MQESIFSFLRQIPFWAWVILPAIFLGGITYLITKHRRQSIIITLIALFAAWLTAGLHFFKVYLTNHFVGSFDIYGLPGQLSRSGWLLLIDAWPLWLVPTIVVAIITSAVLFYLWKYPRHTQTDLNELIDMNQEPSESSPEKNIAYRLELGKQQRKAAKATQRLQQERQKQQSGKKEISNVEKQNALLLKELATKNNELRQVKQELSEQTQALERANALTEKLLDKRYGVNE